MPDIWFFIFLIVLGLAIVRPGRKQKTNPPGLVVHPAWLQRQVQAMDPSNEADASE